MSDTYFSKYRLFSDRVRLSARRYSDDTESLLELLGAKITLTTDTGINIIRRGEPESLRLLKRFNINQQIGISELGILLGE